VLAQVSGLYKGPSATVGALGPPGRSCARSRWFVKGRTWVLVLIVEVVQMSLLRGIRPPGSRGTESATPRPEHPGHGGHHRAAGTPVVDRRGIGLAGWHATGEAGPDNGAAGATGSYLECAPARCTRSRMPISPNPPPESAPDIAEGWIPHPSSATAKTTSSPKHTRIPTRRASACRITLPSDSWTTR